MVSPTKPELKNLQDKHDAWLREQKKTKKTAGAALAAYVDNSVTNLSSIVVLAKLSEKTLLLTGDARGDKILKGLELMGLLKKGGAMHVDALKVPHHGRPEGDWLDIFISLEGDLSVMIPDFVSAPRVFVTPVMSSGHSALWTKTLDRGFGKLSDSNEDAESRAALTFRALDRSYPNDWVVNNSGRANFVSQRKPMHSNEPITD